MTSEKEYYIIGGDRRYDCLAKLFKEKGLRAHRINSPIALDGLLKDCGPSCEVILPYPVSPDGISIIFQDGGLPISELLTKISQSKIKKIHAGAVKPHIRKSAENLGLEIDDYGTDEVLLQRNALCSAEGAIHILMRELPTTVHGSTFTVIGYGRIGRFLACTLKAMGAKVYAVARKAESRAVAELDGMIPRSFTTTKDALSTSLAVINTVPFKVLEEKELRQIPEDSFILDLASSPGGVDRDAADSLNVKVIWALSIPGKYSPLSAAEIILKYILREEGGT